MKIRYNHKLKPRARQLRNSGTLSEVVLWNQLKAKKLGYQFLRQKPIGNYIVDFYCPKLKLVIEIDGSSHADKKDYDRFRDEYFDLIGLHMMRISEAEVNNNLDGIMLRITTFAHQHSVAIPL